jgi:hypothetical protein
LALEKRALVIEWPTKKIKKYINHEWGLVKAIKDQLPLLSTNTKAMKIAKVISVMHTSIVGTRGLRCLDVITNLLKLLS